MEGRLQRRKRKAGLIAALALLVGLAQAAQINPPDAPLQPTANFNTPELTFNAADRVLVLAPHPDDETIACGGVIQKALDMGLAVRVIFLTYGDANEWSFVLYRKQPELLPGQVEAMGLVRHDEALAAARILGLEPGQLTFLGYPDFGTLKIWSTHWGTQPPLRSMFTRVTQVPYASAFRPGAAYKGEEVLADLKTILQDFRPTKVFLSHPTDNNPDHLALYTFTRVALWDLEMAPELYPYLVHSSRWPQPSGQAPARSLAPPASLVGPVSWWTLPLSSEETARKLAALEAHRTQYESNSRYLTTFIRANELFGDYPEVALGAEVADMGLNAAGSEEASEELTDAERAAFVGLEWHSVRREGSDLVVALTLSKPLAKGVALSAYLFGYRLDRPFAAMPKIHVKVGALSHVVYDQSRVLEDTGVQVNRDAHDIVLRVPLASLGEPRRALVYARTYLGDLPLDSAAWRVIDLPGD